ncbi:hypothetical protein EDB89DRAFT_1448999 [Lactarius sanguifluus]|nr:hypothetical protein EDB89DRAFT_1448999 [Lactarius sanguifluus]
MATSINRRVVQRRTRERMQELYVLRHYTCQSIHRHQLKDDHTVALSDGDDVPATDSVQYLYHCTLFRSQQHGPVDPQPFLPSFPPMQPRTPSLAILTSLVLLASSDFAATQINAPDCSLSWEWSFNTRGQNACTVAAYLMGTCNDGTFTIHALLPGKFYTVSNDVANCECNMVAYNLLSACSACQGGNLTTWSNYSYNCIPPLTFPHTVPSGTSVPQWALVDNTFNGIWDPTTASSTVSVDPPEVQPGSLIGIPDSESGSPTPSGSGTNTAAIAGGVAGGIVALAAIGVLLFYFLPVWRRQRSQAPSAATAGDDGETPPMSQEHPPLSGDKTYVPKKPMAPMKLYDPNDPTTFPKYQRVSTSAQDMHDPFAPKDGGSNGNRLNKVQAAPTPGYHGLPIV